MLCRRPWPSSGGQNGHVQGTPVPLNLRLSGVYFNGVPEWCAAEGEWYWNRLREFYSDKALSWGSAGQIASTSIIQLVKI